MRQMLRAENDVGQVQRGGVNLGKGQAHWIILRELRGRRGGL